MATTAPPFTVWQLTQKKEESAQVGGFPSTTILSHQYLATEEIARRYAKQLIGTRKMLELKKEGCTACWHGSYGWDDVHWYEYIEIVAVPVWTQ